MENSIRNIPVLKVEILADESIEYIENTPIEIASYIQFHSKKAIVFRNPKDNYQLFYKYASIGYSEFIEIFYSDIQEYISEITKALSKEQGRAPITYHNVSVFQDSLLFLYSQNGTGFRNYNFLEAELQCSISFNRLLEKLNVNRKDLFGEVQYLLTITYTYGFDPNPIQRFRYKGHDFKVILKEQVNSKTICYFDTIN